MITSTIAIDRVMEVLAELEEQGFALIRGALTPAEAAAVHARIDRARGLGWEEGLNEVGNMWFDTLLDRDREHFAPLVAHPAIRPVLDALYGRQCQLRSLRAHLNPGKYRQEWHLDFYGYWEERRAAAGRPLVVPPVGVNTTFYLQDNLPGRGRLTFLAGTHRQEPPHLYPHDFEAFQAWAERQPRVELHPLAGDCVVFYSQIVHRGAKDDDGMERSNVVCHYQACPMHERVWHVAAPRPFEGSCPLVR
jgi:ectoine hydroxylase-related dioxygenase (phytanoyl-CoA dioxygenase family)